MFHKGEVNFANLESSHILKARAGIEPAACAK